MKWRSTWFLLAVAAGLLAYILLVERHSLPTSETAQTPARLLEFKPEEVTSLQVRRSADLFLRADRTNGEWHLSFPLSYPAQSVAVAGLLEELSRLHRGTFVTPHDLDSRQQTVAQFSLDVPVVTLVLQHAGGRSEVRFGAKTPVGDRVYVQVEDSPNIFVVPVTVYDRLPRTPNEWRDAVVVDLQRLLWDRLEFRTPTRTYALQVDATNRTFVLVKPSPARADRPKVVNLLSAIQRARVQEFVQDNVRVDLELYGLQTPAAELIFGLGTNEACSVRFGISPTNDPSRVYAILSAHTNLVLVSQSLLDTLQTSHTDLREKRLLAFSPEGVDLIEIDGQTNWVLRRQPEGTWAMLGTPTWKADAELVRNMFDRLERLQGEVERDVVADFSTYGLTGPSLRYRLYSVLTNASGLPTNRLVGGLDFGTQQEDKVYVRRIDEQSVYSVPRTEFEQLPREAWQTRDRQVWSFNTNEIVQVTLRLPERTVALLRTGSARWELAPGSQGIINPLAVEETMFRLGDLHADFWVARGSDQRARFGFAEPRFQIGVELKGPDGQTQVRTLEFGQSGPSQFPFALTEIDGHPVIFEFPKKLYFEMVRDLLKPFWKGASLPL